MHVSAITRLTEQQQQIVDHGAGPALVFAVAGAGKTTAMIHRIERLVREKVAAPRRILATSFGRATVEDIRRALQPWPHCSGVKVSTLHAVGNYVLRLAQSWGLGEGMALDTDSRADLDKQILFQALSAARKERVAFMDELETLDHEDFLNYVGACKGNLRYADWGAMNLPEAAGGCAGQATAPAGMPWYLDLYKVFERVRQRRGLVTFDDMLMSGWELLMTYPELLREVQGLYDYVLVDEFQDVNRAQFEILDLLTSGHRNYMAIGDDDQTIYEWRGASVQFILDFPKRYDAQAYLINDNFRCKASHVVLANRVIEHNRTRRPKHLSLTQGFDGTTSVAFDETVEQMGRRVVGDIQAALREGRRPEEIAVLVRLYAQTPPIEQHLIAEGIPYQVVGSVPFYRRPEITALLHYCHLAQVERTASYGLSEEEILDFSRAWHAVYNRPKRYISQDIAERVRTAVANRGLKLSAALQKLSADAPNRGIMAKMDNLAGDIAWLADRLERGSAEQVLRELDGRLGYRDYLRQSGGFPETGEGRAANVAALLDYARGKGTVREFLQHLAELAAEREAEERQRTQPAITITTIFRAKGLEWPMVLIPNCNQGTIPFGEPQRLPEERRLFYVAVTRAKRALHLYCLKDAPLSQFLREADYRQTLDTLTTVQSALDRDPQTWSAQEALAVARSGRQFQLERFFAQWWEAQPEHKLSVARSVQRFFSQVESSHLAGLLRLSREHLQVWQTIAPLAPDEAAQEFPGFEQLMPRAGRAAVADPEPPEARFRCGDKVQHSAFGVGTVLQIERSAQDEDLTIIFPKVGVKKLSALHANLRLVSAATIVPR